MLISPLLESGLDKPIGYGITNKANDTNGFADQVLRIMAGTRQRTLNIGLHLLMILAQLSSLFYKGRLLGPPEAILNPNL